MSDKSISQEISKSSGLNFGTFFQVGLYPVTKGSKLILKYLDQATLIIAFDALIENVDRRQEDPNLLFSENTSDFIVYDHELAFSFVYQIGTNSINWGNRYEFIRQHIFFPAIKGKILDFSDFTNKLKNLDNKKIESILELPNEFECPHVNKIFNHLIDVRENCNNFKKGLKEVLA
ncbi:MAG: hypothetical protein A2161_05220 [Candidatus Schekmanbacteria bacterium RBG_13_48_7]|uniref:HipA-like kinase domain-containing protein n=1 Tax=Candidatus Schekmanbacteria bacterium RBG_13_48_7 TaxID=1817878 RepID=A0A1F7RNV4_9BACT|nr:MAG: hypothetical protein A2161_05220 [Candidatus Schekmanbacteria bacterium RBG_13_48_7]